MTERPLRPRTAGNEYEVTVTFGPETVSVLAKNEDDARHRAVWTIGLAGFETLGLFSVEGRPPPRPP